MEKLGTKVGGTSTNALPSDGNSQSFIDSFKKRSTSRGGNTSLYKKIKSTKKKFSSISCLRQITNNLNNTGKDRTVIQKEFARKVGKKLGMAISKSRLNISKEKVSKDSLESQNNLSNFRRRRLKNYLKNLSSKKSRENRNKSRTNNPLFQSDFPNNNINISSLSTQKCKKGDSKSPRIPKRSSNIPKNQRTLNFGELSRTASKYFCGNNNISTETKRYKEKFFEMKKENKMLKNTLKKAISLINSSNMMHRVKNNFFN